MAGDPYTFIYPARSPCMGIHPWGQSLGLTRCGYCGCAIVGSHEVQRLDRAMRSMVTEQSS